MFRSILSVVKNVNWINTNTFSNILKPSKIVSSLEQNRSICCTAVLNRERHFRISAPGLFLPEKPKLFEKMVGENYIDRHDRNIKFSLEDGKKVNMDIVLKKFYRLDWGCWIHAKCGRSKSLYKKSANRRRRLQQHVMCNASQSWLLDKMVTKYWRQPKYYVDDPYEPYHSREEFRLSRKKPYNPFL